MFSERASFALAPNRIAEAVQARRGSGAPLLDLTESNPTAVGLGAPPGSLALLSDTRAARYEPEAFGLAAAREAVAGDFRRRGVPVAPDRVVLSASSSEAYAWLFKLLCDPGDAVLVPRPSYPLFEYLARLESVAVESYPLRYDGEWHLAPDEVARALGPRTRALIVVTPNNPTGSFLKRDELAALKALCAERGAALVSDEVFADYAFAPDPRRAPSAAHDGPCLAFALGGLSKSCGLPQLKLGWTAVSGPGPLVHDALSRLELIADSYLSVSTPVQVAAPELLARLPQLQRPIAERVRRNLDALERALGGQGPATLLRTEGGWTAVLRVPATLTEEERVLRLLNERGVLVHPGFFFDMPAEAYLVLSLLPRPECFDAGLAGLLADLVL